MLNEKHNDPFGWKNKLEGLIRLPGEHTADNNAAWERLHDRLQYGRRRRKAIWYWAAAAILLAFIIPLMIANKKQNIVVKSEPQQQNKIMPALQLPVPSKETVKTPVQAEKKQFENRIPKYKSSTTVKTTVKKEAPPIANAENNIVKDPLPIIIPANITDTASTILASVPVKKKLSVVHINELASPSVQAFPPSNYAQAPLKIKFKNGKTAGQGFAPQQQYAGGFKIRLSPKN